MKKKTLETLGGILLTVAFCALVIVAIIHIPEHATSMFWRP